MSTTSPFLCPQCGSDVHPNASGCRECGAIKEDGEWISPDSCDGLDLPDDEFDYEEFIRNEFGEGEPTRPSAKRIFWWLTAVVTLVAFLWISLGGW